MDHKKAFIINWTNECNIPSLEQVESSWKIQLQLFLLAETEEILVNNISLIYCFVNSDKFPTLYQFSYSQEQYNSFKQRLEMALSNLPNSLLSDSEDSSPNNLDEAELNLQIFLNGEMTTYEYLKTIPEVEI